MWVTTSLSMSFIVNHALLKFNQCDAGYMCICVGCYELSSTLSNLWFWLAVHETQHYNIYYNHLLHSEPTFLFIKCVVVTINTELIQEPDANEPTSISSDFEDEEDSSSDFSNTHYEANIIGEYIVP